VDTINKSARVAGVLYLLYIVVQVIGSVWLKSFTVAGDAAATASNLVAHERLFTGAVVGDLVAAALFFLVAWALYSLLKPVNSNLALLFLALNLAGVVIQCVSALNLFAALLLMNGAATMQAVPADQLQALAMFFLELRDKGFAMAQLFYGAWLFPLGYLVFKSGFLPKLLGLVFMIHCVFWLLTFLQSFLFPDFVAITYLSYPLGLIAELGLSLWLVLKGARAPKPA
jgi:hypothetical protein